MEFEPLYYGEKIKIVNPAGDVGVVTLWSLVKSMLGILHDIDIDLAEGTSRIAVIANLYGNGLPQMLRNLLWNPQIRHIVVVGHNLSGSREWLVNFFNQGLEEVEFLGSKAFRIKGTERIIDGEVKPEHFPNPPKIIVFDGKIGELKTQNGIQLFFNELFPINPCEFNRVSPPLVPEPVVTRFPSDPRGHTIIRNSPLDAWLELIFRLYRFGHRNKIFKSTGEEVRVELQSVRVVINDPREESAELLKKYGFDLEHMFDYQARILDPVKPADLSYSYGNRLRGYFKHEDGLVDSLQIVAEHLKKSPESRHEYIALWDNSRDLPEGKGCPCFVSAFFRLFDGKLTLTATFRTHNAMNAWLENVYGLIAIQRFVAERAGMEVGPITVISHSISIDPSALEGAKKIAESKRTDEVIDHATGKTGLRLDPNGEFTITIDRFTWEIVLEHSYGGMKVGEYRGKKAEIIERQLARDCALSEISHALYLGRELARKQVEMEELQKR